MAFRTINVINLEVDKAYQKYREHCNTCAICQAPIESAEDEMTCYAAEWLLENAERLADEASNAREHFIVQLEELLNDLKTGKGLEVDHG